MFYIIQQKKRIVMVKSLFFNQHTHRSNSKHQGVNVFTRGILICANQGLSHTDGNLRFFFSGSFTSATVSAATIGVLLPRYKLSPYRLAITPQSPSNIGKNRPAISHICLFLQHNVATKTYIILIHLDICRRHSSPYTDSGQ